MIWLQVTEPDDDDHQWIYGIPMDQSVDMLERDFALFGEDNLVIISYE